MRVLIKSAGNKKHLIQEFQKYADVVVEDKDLNAKCFLWADASCSRELPDLIVKTRDEDIKHPICWDKAEFNRFCRRHGFDTPETWLADKDQKFFVKPRNGSGSNGVFIIDRSQLVQEFIDWPEYTIDYFADYEGNTLSCIPRKRLQVVGGESQACEIVDDPYLISEATRMGQELGIKGPAAMQVFYNGKKIKWIEVNPRFGGGSHFTWPLFSGPKWMCEEFKMRANSHVSKGNQVPEVR